jgi:F420-dependent oxidoreductase-like protein
VSRYLEGQVRVGVHSGQQHTSYEAYAHLWETVEALGLDWASVFDHFLPIQSDSTGPCFEGPTLLAAMAARTRRIACGIVVTGVTYRHPALLAKIAATLDHVSGGRFELGMGAAWNDLEHRQYGIPLPTLATRVEMLDEAAEIVRRLLTESEVGFEGRHYHLAGAYCEPKPLPGNGVPLWVGGAGERRTLPVVARRADGWNTFLIPMDAYRRKLAVLAEECASIGRDPDDIRKALVFRAVLGETRNEAEDELAARSQQLGVEPGELARQTLALTAEECIDLLRPYAELGVEDFLLMARPPLMPRTLEVLAHRVAPALRGVV